MKKELLFNFLVIVIFLIIVSCIWFNTCFNILTSIIWAIATLALLGSGIYYSYKTKFVQLKISKMILLLLKKNKNSSGISSFSSLAMSLAGRIGVGSLAGVSLAIYIGGPGSIFWMWVTSIIISCNTYIEAYLGVAFQEKDISNINKGGPAYYIKKGLNYPYLSGLYAVIIIISYIGGFLTIQTNTIVKSINSIITINPFLIIIIIAIITSIIIFKDLKRIAKFNVWIVSIMGIIYLTLGIFIIIKNITIIPGIIKCIFTSAFNLKSFIGGFLYTLIIGIQRGVFASETGLGTSSITASTTKDTPHDQGLIQTFGIHITTFVVCTITTFIILSTDYPSLQIIDINGIEITSYAFSFHFGNYGSIFLTIIVILFSYSTIITGYYYGESNLKFLFNNISKRKINIFKIICIIIISLGGIITSTIIWNLVDVCVAILIIINIYAILKLYRIIK